MAESWQRNLEVLRFVPDGPEVMRGRVEDVEIVAVPHPWKGLALMTVHADSRTITEGEVFVPLDASVQELAKALKIIFEEVHPERREQDER